jgi:hypothetical protein
MSLIVSKTDRPGYNYVINASFFEKEQDRVSFP